MGSNAYVILGATGAVGTELVRQLTLAGNQVFAAGRDTARLFELAASLACPHAVVDASRPETIEAAVQQAHDAFGRLDGLANCIGSVLLKPAHTTSLDEWADTIQVNLTSSFVALKSAAAVMRSSGGSIVLVSSAAARLGLANHEAIAAAKAGIVGLARSAAASYADRGIRVNAVAPGLVKSHMTRRLWESEAMANASCQMHALGRLGEPAEVARMIGWLLQPENSWITGQVFGIDGGLGTVVPRMKVRAT